MPTATTVVGPYTVEFHNIGALTSGWTRPTEVCSTVPLAPSGVSFPLHDKVMGLQVDNCGGYTALWVPECEPGGEALDELYSSQESPSAVLIGYHSPGLQCPEAWETVGVIAMNNGTPSASGLFSPTVFTHQATETTSFPPANFLANALTSVLAPTETAVACCPSGYSADPWAGCYSNFPLTELANKTACEYVYAGDDHRTGSDALLQTYTYTWDYFGTTTTAEAYSVHTPAGWTNLDNFNTSTTTLGLSGMPTEYADSDNNREKFTGLALREPIWFVHSDEGAEGNDSEPPESAARTLAPTTAWAAIGGVLAAWGVGMVAGVGLLAAW